MMRFIIVPFLFFSIIFNVSGQLNKEYIQTELEKIDELIINGDYVDGLIYMNNDTLERRLLAFKGKRKMNNYLFCVSKDINDTIKILNPSNITGYQINNTEYVSYFSGNDFFFLKLVKTGTINLYLKQSIPSDKRFLYFIKFPNYNNYYVINPNENFVSEYLIPDSNQSESSGAVSTIYKSSGTNEKFKVFIKSFFDECPTLINMVNSDFYTINDNPSIVEIYNECIKQNK